MLAVGCIRLCCIRALPSSLNAQMLVLIRSMPSSELSRFLRMQMRQSSMAVAIRTLAGRSKLSSAEEVAVYSTDQARLCARISGLV